MITLKHISSFLFAAILHIGSSYTVCGQQQDSQASSEEAQHYVLQYEKEITKDPATGDVPRERLIEVRLKMESSKVMGAIPGVVWKERGPKNLPGRIRAIMLDPNDTTYKRVFAGSIAGGLWRCNDITSSTTVWSPVNDFYANLAVTCINYDPSNIQTMYFGTGEGWQNTDAIRGEGIFKSTDGGISWAQLPSTANATFYYVQRIAVATNGDVYAATAQGLQKSTDGGSTWIQVLGAGNGSISSFIADVELSINGDVWASCGLNTTDGVYKSPSGNAGSFTQMNTGGNGLPTGLYRTELAISPTNGLFVYALPAKLIAGKYKTDYIYVSGDGGVSWTASPTPVDINPGMGGTTDITLGQATYTNTVTVDPNNSTVVFIGGMNIFKSNDGGVTWLQLSDYDVTVGYSFVHNCQHQIIFQPGNSNVAMFANDGGVYRSVNTTSNTPSIVPRTDNLNTTLNYSCAIDPNKGDMRIWSGTENNSNIRLNSTGIGNATLLASGLTGVTSGGNGGFYHIDYNDNAVHYASFTNIRLQTPFINPRTYFYRSTNGGISYTYLGLKDNNSPVSITAYDSVGNYFYSGTLTTGQYMVMDNVMAMVPGALKSLGAAGSGGKIRAICVSPNTNTTVYFGLHTGKIVKVLNAPTTPVATLIGTPVINSNVSCIIVEKGNENHIIVTYSNYGIGSVWETTNGGTTWTNIENNLPDMPVRWAIFNPANNTQVLLATELGVWSTDLLNGGATNWGATNTGLANVRVDMLSSRPSDSIIIAATHGRGLFSCDVFSSMSVNFTADKKIRYTNKNIQFTDASVKATSWTWSFGDATSSTLQNPIHQYTAPGKYNVTLTINGGVMSESKTQYIHILPNRVAPYLYSNGGDFETNLWDFGSDHGDNGTPWELGNSIIAGKNGVLSGVNAWVTGLTNANYQSEEDISLMTPNFDLTVNPIFNLEFFAKYKTENGNDGFRVEYSLDKGDNWLPLGTYSPPIWYNNLNNFQNTAFPKDDQYFSSDTVTVYNRCFWGISPLAGLLNVAFRIHFRSDGSVNLAGVAIDNFQIFIPDPLPIEWLTLTGSHLQTYNRLRWCVADESRVSTYIIERSGDGINFVTIGETKPQGKFITVFNDNNLEASLYYYRIRSVDINGSQSVSKIIKIASKDIIDSQLILTPNPATDVVFFEGIDLAYNSIIQIFSTDGRVIVSRKLTNAEEDATAMNIKDLHLPAGIYLFSVVTPHGKYTTKLAVR